MIREFLPLNRSARVAVFLSGSGTNAEKLLEFRAACPACRFDIVLLVTDRPQESRAAELAERFKLPLAALDIREFYRRHGLESTSLATERGREVRERWTGELRRRIAGYAIDFAVLAGFVPLTNLTGDFPCLNVHPGDLTVVGGDGRRLLVGLHAIPVEKAILAGAASLRSSVILALPYREDGHAADMDNGPLLGISAPVPVELGGYSLDALRAMAASRPARRPKGGFRDGLSEVAARNLQHLKEAGDWTILPRVTADFAAGRFGTDGTQLFFRQPQGSFRPVRTVEYRPDGTAAPGL